MRRALVSWSGGEDSFLAAHLAMDEGAAIASGVPMIRRNPRGDIPIVHESALVGDCADGEHPFDLRGVSAKHARMAICQMLERPHLGDSTSVVIPIDQATATSGETLFLPVGRHLLEARRRGLVTRFHSLPQTGGGGFYVELPIRPRHAEARE
jgi:hypothetical protein